MGSRVRNVKCINGTLCSNKLKPHDSEACFNPPCILTTSSTTTAASSMATPLDQIFSTTPETEEIDEIYAEILISNISNLTAIHLEKVLQATLGDNRLIKKDNESNLTSLDVTEIPLDYPEEISLIKKDFQNITNSSSSFLPSYSNNNDYEYEDEIDKFDKLYKSEDENLVYDDSVVMQIPVELNHNQKLQKALKNFIKLLKENKNKSSNNYLSSTYLVKNYNLTLNDSEIILAILRKTITAPVLSLNKSESKPNREKNSTKTTQITKKVTEKPLTTTLRTIITTRKKTTSKKTTIKPNKTPVKNKQTSKKSLLLLKRIELKHVVLIPHWIIIISWGIKISL